VSAPTAASAFVGLFYLGDGVSEDIISMLSRFPDLSVVTRNSSFVYKGKPVDVRQIGRDLDVDYALEGSVRKEADQIRIVAQLIDTQTGKHVWAERYDKSGTDPQALQDEVTGKIVDAIGADAGQIKRGQYHDAWGKDTADLANTTTIFAVTMFSLMRPRERRTTAPDGSGKKGWRNIPIRTCSR
jgi:adenylate cyclase